MQPLLATEKVCDSSSHFNTARRPSPPLIRGPGFCFPLIKGSGDEERRSGRFFSHPSQGEWRRRASLRPILLPPSQRAWGFFSSLIKGLGFCSPFSREVATKSVAQADSSPSFSRGLGLLLLPYQGPRILLPPYQGGLGGILTSTSEIRDYSKQCSFIILSK